MNLHLLENTEHFNLWDQPERPEDFWAALFDQMPYCMVVFNREGRILMANDEAARRLNLSEEDEFILPDHLMPLKAGAFQFDPRNGRPKIVTMPSPADGNPITFQLRHLTFGEGLVLAIGQSAVAAPGFPQPQETLDETAAVATEVHRQVTGPLAGIELYASIVGQELEDAGDSALADIVEQIRSGVREVNEYLTSFSSMAEPLTLNPEQHRLMDIVDEALGAMNTIFKERRIGVLVTQKDLQITADRGLMVQALLNILFNSVEAMPLGGRIFVEFDTDKPGQVEIIVTDTGPGVSLELMKKVFSPFYTTKKQPLGLGLPVSLRIAQAHQGNMFIGSDLNMGARAVLSLPYLPDGDNTIRLN